MRRLIAATALCLLAGAAQAQAPAAVPEVLARAGDVPLLRLSATGVQVYECRTGADGTAAWALKEPRADLFRDGQRVGRHGAGPFWEYADGSRIVGRAVAALPAPQPGDIPWLRLAVTAHGGAGTLEAVNAVQRVATRGGAMAGPCATVGALTEVPYAADYVMLRAETP